MNIGRQVKGFSIVELMVALLLGLFLVSGVTAMYISSKQTYRVTDNLSRLQENLRFGLEFMSRDIRMAGYMPCRFSSDVENAIVNGDSTWYLDFFDFGIRGYEGHATTPAANVVPNSDAIAILKGGIYSASVGTHSSTTSTITLQDSMDDNYIKNGSAVIMCDPRQAAILQASSVTEGDSSTNATIVYGDNSTISPGNDAARLASIGSFGDDAIVTPLETVIYYLRQNPQGPNTLARQYLTPGSTQNLQMTYEPLLEGVESMQILYGEDTDNDQIVNRYIDASAVTSWQDVISVRLGLLMATGEEVAATLDTKTYNVAGTLIANTATTPTHPADRKLRYVTNTTINLRNRVQ